MVWSKLIQRLDSAISMISLFLSNNANKFITHTHTHTPFFKNDCPRVD
jgi:hypothetical protein